MYKRQDPILFFYLLRKNLPWFGIILTISIASAFVYLRYTVPIYESTLKFQVGTKNTANQVLEVNDFHESRDDLAKDVQILTSKLLFKRSLERLPLDVTYFKQGEILDHELYGAAPIKVDYEVKDSAILGHQFFIEFIDQKKYRLSDINLSLIHI